MWYDKIAATFNCKERKSRATTLKQKRGFVNQYLVYLKSSFLRRPALFSFQEK